MAASRGAGSRAPTLDAAGASVPGGLPKGDVVAPLPISHHNRRIEENGLAAVVQASSNIRPRPLVPDIFWSGTNIVPELF